MHERQRGLCYICKKPSPVKKLLSVDHDHKTGKVRKLLCHYCNTGLGYLKEDINLLLEAIKYLNEHSGA